MGDLTKPTSEFAIKIQDNCYRNSSVLASYTILELLSVAFHNNALQQLIIHIMSAERSHNNIIRILIGGKFI